MESVLKKCHNTEVSLKESPRAREGKIQKTENCGVSTLPQSKKKQLEKTLRILCHIFNI